ncbi:MAG TPA: SDR family NAD(P)-dependent oxidoreductase [Chloroflexota bacterium]|nr:SDR family NAD(P)-dependent oxidoreductase [Chloroflexota bacterium]
MHINDTKTRGTMLITGGAGFVGSNLAHTLLTDGWPVVVLDNFSRAGVDQNAAWLRETHGDRIEIVVGDIRDSAAIQEALCRGESAGGRVAGVFHFAAQVAVTSSLRDPMHDFSVNVGGTINLIEALRRLASPPPLVSTSTNKVYGELAGLETRRVGDRYVPLDPAVADHGVSEEQGLDFRSPYGCSKGAADQYVLEYARTFGVPAAVFRMSCIYGPRQFGTEDQGWVAHFLITALSGAPITLYGDGCQVRDCLYVDDLVRAFRLAHAGLSGAEGSKRAELSGQAFNIGGGACRAVSLLEVLEIISACLGRRPTVEFAPWRLGDQRYFVSDTRKFAAATGWVPRVGVREGLIKLLGWLRRPEVESGAYVEFLPLWAEGIQKQVVDGIGESGEHVFAV